MICQAPFDVKDKSSDYFHLLEQETIYIDIITNHLMSILLFTVSLLLDFIRPHQVQYA